jgi:hypothetical protein
MLTRNENGRQSPPGIAAKTWEDDSGGLPCPQFNQSKRLDTAFFVSREPSYAARSAYHGLGWWGLLVLHSFADATALIDVYCLASRAVLSRHVRHASPFAQPRPADLRFPWAQPGCAARLPCREYGNTAQIQSGRSWSEKERG